MALASMRALRDARIRVQQYARLLSWLFSRAIGTARARLLLPPVLVLASLGLEIGALFFMVRIVTQVQVDQSGVLSDATVLAELGIETSTYAKVFSIPAMLVLAGLTKYASRVSALGIERQMIDALTREFLDKLASLAGTFERWALNQKFDLTAIFRTASNGPRVCATAIRLVLFNMLNFVHLIAGLSLLVFLSPGLLLPALGVGLLGLMVAYPLSLKAVQVGKELEDSAGTRTAGVQQRVRAAMGLSKADMKTQKSSDETEQAEARFLDILVDRLRIIEISNLVFMILLAGVVGAFLTLLLEGKAASILDTENIIILFFALRYAFGGFQGIIVMATAINRYLPSIVQFQGAITTLDAIMGERKNRCSWMETPLHAGFPWRLDAQESHVQEGRIKAGEVCLVASAQDKQDSVALQFLDVLTGQHARFAAVFDRSFGALAAKGDSVETADNGLSLRPSSKSDVVDWITSILSDCGIDATAKQITEAIAGHDGRMEIRPGLIRLLASAHLQTEAGTGIVLISKPLLLWHETGITCVRTVLEHLRDHIVLIISPWDELLCNHCRSADWLFVSDGKQLSYVGHIPDMTEDDWAAARARYEIKQL